MDRLVRARVLLEEAAALGVLLADLVAVSASVRDPESTVPTIAEYVDAVDTAMGGRTAETYRSHWRLLVARLCGVLCRVGSGYRPRGRSWLEARDG
jgi:hypothetical protein